MIPVVDRDVARPATVSLRLRKVLLVDDALPVRGKMIEILNRIGGVHGEQVSSAETVESAMEIFAREHPSLVFCELVGAHPGDGLAMITSMLRLDPHVRIVLVTSEDQQSTAVRQAIRMGVFAVVSKPLRHEKVRQVLAEIEAEESGIMRFR